MLKQKPERVTYAQAKLLKLIENRDFRKFCDENGLSHAHLFKIAYGELNITYRIMSKMCHLIPVIEWLFYTDEELPYKPETLPKWDPDQNSCYIMKHREDYIEEGQKYGLTENVSKNLFRAYKTHPSVMLIRKACAENNPIDFFRYEEDTMISLRYVPERGDVITNGTKVYVTLSKKQKNINMVVVVPLTRGGIGNANEVVLNSIKMEPMTIRIDYGVRYIQSLPKKSVDRILAEVKKIFE